MTLDRESAAFKVLIVGAGPCGLMAAILLARYGIGFIIIDKLPARNRAGKSESIQSRTLEVFESLGLREKVEQKGQRVSEYAVYTRDVHNHLQRSKVAEDVTVPTKYPYTVNIDKGELECVLEHELRRLGHQVRMQVECVLLTKPEQSGDVWHVAVVDHVSGMTEMTSPVFVLGCDGADSVVRRHLGIRSRDFLTNSWAVADVTLNTDLEDIRRRCTVQSARGNCILTPRRNGVRMRTLLTPIDLATDEWDLGSASFVGIESALRARIAAAISPRSIELTKVSWVRRFAVAKHLAERFSDQNLEMFLLGNAACVTSPLTRQGSNGGLMDAWNLCWKVAQLLSDKAARSVLSSYNLERRGFFLKAIEFDLRAEQAFAIRDNLKSEFVALYEFKEASGYTSGCGCRYPPSQLVQEEKRTFSNKGIEILTPGKRLLPATIIRHVDGNEVNVLELLGVNLRFKLFVFLGHMMKTGLPMVHGAAGYLSSKRSPLTLGMEDGSCEPQVDLFIIHTLPHLAMSTQDFPQPLSQYADHIFEDVGARWHKDVGVVVSGGCYCLVRPDGYIAIVSNLDDCDRVRTYVENLR